MKQIPKHQRSLRLSRGFGSSYFNRHGANRRVGQNHAANGQIADNKPPVVRFFEETEDGNRTEVHHSQSEETFPESTKSILRKLRGQQADKLTLDDLDGRGKLSEDELEKEVVNSLMEENEMANALDSQSEDLTARRQIWMRALEQENIPEEELSRIRKELLKISADGIKHFNLTENGMNPSILSRSVH
jgi:hypothetical protein